jgi:zinc finger protein
MLLSQKEPLRHTLVVDGLDDLNVRVIRSTSGTIRIPELGIDVEPGFASESYISNVEGVLERIRTIVEFATNAARRAGDIQKTERGLAILEKLDNVLVGYGSLTLVLEDPFGNSAMISEDVVVTPLTPEELESLKTGMIVLDRSCL